MLNAGLARAERPIALVTDPSTGDAYLAERVGRVRPIDLDSGALGDPIVDISDRTRAEGERGLLGVAFSPDGARLYLSSTSIAAGLRFSTGGWAKPGVGMSRWLNGGNSWRRTISRSPS